MKTIRDALRDADPITQEPPWALEDAARVRRVVLSAPVPGGARWLGVSFVVAFSSLVAGVLWFVLSGGAAPKRALEVQSSVRQIHFVSPGGTRIIWILDARQ